MTYTIRKKLIFQYQNRIQMSSSSLYDYSIINELFHSKENKKRIDKKRNNGKAA